MDYAAAPTQPIIQGVVNIILPEVEIVEGTPAEVRSAPARSASRIRAARRAGFQIPDPALSFYGLGVSAIRSDLNGNVLLTLDMGVPGNVGIDSKYARTLVTIRGTGSPPNTFVDEKLVSYPDTRTVAIMFMSEGFVVFPFQFEVIVWRGNATPSDYSAQIIGPLI